MKRFGRISCRGLGGRGAIALMALALLGGCTQYQWMKDGATQDDYNRDIYACEMEAARTFPTMPGIQPVSPGFMTPARTFCRTVGDHTSCHTAPGFFMPPAMGTVDLNADNRSRAVNLCMVARGWQLVEVR